MNAPRATDTGILFIHGLAKNSIIHYLSGTRFRAHLNDALQGAAR